MNNPLNEISKVYLEQVLSEEEIVAESVFQELLEEGFEESDLREAIDGVLTEVSSSYYDSAVKSSKKKSNELKRKEFMSKVRSRLANAQVAAYNKGRELKQKAGDTINKAKQSAAGKVFQAKKAPEKVKKGLKGFIKKQAEKVVNRMSEDYSDWRSDLIEVSGYNVADKAHAVPTKGKKSEELDQEITVKNVKNKIVINPSMKEEFASIGAEVIEVSEIDEKINMRTADVGDVVKDFYKSDAPQFKGKSKEKRRQMAIAAKLEAEDQNEEFTLEDMIEFLVTEGYVWDRAGAEKMLEVSEEGSMSSQEIALQKRKAIIDQMIARKRKQSLDKGQREQPVKAMGEAKELSVDDQMKISREAAKKRNPNPDYKAIRAKMMKKPLPKDTRTDAQKMTDATGPRPGSNYRGD